MLGFIIGTFISGLIKIGELIGYYLGIASVYVVDFYDLVLQYSAIIWDGLLTKLTAILESVKMVFNTVIATIVGIWQQFSTFLVKVFGNAIDVVVDKLSSPIEAVKQLFEYVKGIVAMIPSIKLPDVGGAVSGAMDTVSDTTSSAYSSVKNFLGFGEDDKKPQPMKVKNLTNTVNSRVDLNINNNTGYEIASKTNNRQTNIQLNNGGN